MTVKKLGICLVALLLLPALGAVAEEADLCSGLFCAEPEVLAVGDYSSRQDVLVVDGFRERKMVLLEGSNGNEAWRVAIPSDANIAFELPADSDGKIAVLYSDPNPPDVGEYNWDIAWVRAFGLSDGAELWAVEADSIELLGLNVVDWSVLRIEPVPDITGDDVDEVAIVWRAEDAAWPTTDLNVLEIRDGLSGSRISWRLTFGDPRIVVVPRLFGDEGDGLVLSCAPSCRQIEGLRVTDLKSAWTYRPDHRSAIAGVSWGELTPDLLVLEFKELNLGGWELDVVRLDGRLGQARWRKETILAEPYYAFLARNWTQVFLAGIAQDDPLMSPAGAMALDWSDGKVVWDSALELKPQGAWATVFDSNGDGLEDVHMAFGESFEVSIVRLDGLDGAPSELLGEFIFPTLPYALGVDFNGDGIQELYSRGIDYPYLVDGSNFSEFSKFPVARRIGGVYRANLTAEPAEVLLLLSDRHEEVQSIVALSQLEVLWTRELEVK